MKKLPPPPPGKSFVNLITASSLSFRAISPSMSRYLTRPLFFILLLASCQEPEILQIRNEKLPKISYTTLDREPKLKQAIEQVGISNKQMSFGRLMSGISKIKTDSILRVLQTDSLNYTYTIAIDEDTRPLLRTLFFKGLKMGFMHLY